jgi:hypothetical protein
VVEGIQKIRSGMKVRPVSEQTFEKKDKTVHAPPKRSRASMGRFLPGSTDSLMS